MPVRTASCNSRGLPVSKGTKAFIVSLIVYGLVSLYAYQQDREMERMADELGVDLDEE